MGNHSDVQCRYRYVQLKRAGIAREMSPPSAPATAPFAEAEQRAALPAEDDTNAEQRHTLVSDRVAEPIGTVKALINWTQAEEGAY